MKNLLGNIAAAVALSLVTGATAHAAEAFPVRPIRMIVPLPPGTASDFLARTIGAPLSEHYKQQIVVDNRPGAGGLIGSGIRGQSHSRRLYPRAGGRSAHRGTVAAE